MVEHFSLYYFSFNFLVHTACTFDKSGVQSKLKVHRLLSVSVCVHMRETIYQHLCNRALILPKYCYGNERCKHLLTHTQDTTMQQGAFWIRSWIRGTSGERFVVPVTASKVLSVNDLTAYTVGQWWAESTVLLKKVQLLSAVTSGHHVLRNNDIIKALNSV